MAHNKKRNTAFLFESLMREGTKAIIEKDTKKATFVKNLLLKHFNPSTELKKELDLYNSLKKESVEEDIAEKYLQEVKIRYSSLDKKKIFNEQSSLISVINKTLGQGFYNNFIPDYKSIATISQFFNDQTPIKEKILLENSILEDIKKVETVKESLQPVDKLLYKTFAKKFNEKYSSLLSEQKDLLSRYVNSFADSGLELKIFLNEEIERLKEGVKKALSAEEIKFDRDMENKTLEVQKFLSNFKDAKEISKEMLEKILKVQQFVHEVSN